MSHRTRDLPNLSGVAHWLRELRYHEFSRQALGLVVVVICALAGQPSTRTFYIAAIIVVLGILVRLYASGFIVKNKELATNGPYALVRHPLYTGNVLILLGFTLATEVWWTWLLSAGFLWFYYPTAIEYEDRKLHGIFGDQWVQWRERMPALIPALGNWRELSSGDWSFAKSLKENLEPVIVVFLIFWAWFLWRQI
jgi:protein-S-isoprenylcysteine O-methyltransferase Ste14